MAVSPTNFRARGTRTGIFNARDMCVEHQSQAFGRLVLNVAANLRQRNCGVSTNQLDLVDLLYRGSCPVLAGVHRRFHAHAISASKAVSYGGVHDL